MDLVADELGHGSRGRPARELPPARRLPVRQPERAADRGQRLEAVHRLGQLRAGAGQGARACRLRPDMAAKKADAKARGKLLGVGLSTYIEVCGVAPLEVDRRRGRGLGRRDVGVGQHQGPPHRQDRRHARAPSPTARATRRPTPRSSATSWASRWTTSSSSTRTPRAPRSATARTAARTSNVGTGAALKAAAKIREKARRYAAHMLEATPDDIEVDGAEYRVKGSPDKKKTIQEIAFALDLAFDTPEGMEPYLDETAYHDTPNCTFPFGTHVAIVEVDEETGVVDLARYVAVDDVGKKINPMIVDGQLHGGITQGIGQALWEGAIYGDDGQLLIGLDARLRAAAGVVAARVRARRDGHPVAGQPAGRQGRRRGRLHRQHRGGRQRRDRRAQPAGRPAPRHAVHGAEGLGRHPGRRREARHDPGGVRVHPGRQRRRGAAARWRPTAEPRSSPVARACCR